jgi:acetyltransferase-like isoleucine patch superfamily enzyme
VKRLKYYNKSKALFSVLKGMIFRILFLSGASGKKLRIGKNVVLRGELRVGDNVRLESNVKIYNYTDIGDNVIIGDNVELRSNGTSKVVIGKNTSINRNSMIMGLVTIGKNCAIAPGCVIVGSNHNFDNKKENIKEQGLSRKGIIIDDDVWFGANVVVLDGVKIGKGSVIGAGSVVTKSIPEYSIAVGNPCKIIKQRNK